MTRERITPGIPIKEPPARYIGFERIVQPQPSIDQRSELPVVKPMSKELVADLAKIEKGFAGETVIEDGETVPLWRLLGNQVFVDAKGNYFAIYRDVTRDDDPAGTQIWFSPYDGREFQWIDLKHEKKTVKYQENGEEKEWLSKTYYHDSLVKTDISRYSNSAKSSDWPETLSTDSTVITYQLNINPGQAYGDGQNHIMNVIVRKSVGQEKVTVRAWNDSVNARGINVRGLGKQEFDGQPSSDRALGSHVVEQLVQVA